MAEWFKAPVLKFDNGCTALCHPVLNVPKLHEFQVGRGPGCPILSRPLPVGAVADCTMIRAEIEANNLKTTQLANEQGWKVAQNVGAGVVGLVIWPVWFGMDFDGKTG